MSSIDWKYYKDIGPWPLVFQQDRNIYNEGNLISSKDNHIWGTDFTGDPITPVHSPGCGYWHDKPTGTYNKGLIFPATPYYPGPDPCIHDPDMSWDSEVSPETIGQGASVAIAVKGLNTPFTWSIQGYGFSLESLGTIGVSNILHASEDSCGPATIEVTGCDDVKVTGYVRGVVGQWVSSGLEPVCQHPGIGSVTILGLNFEVESLSGICKQLVVYTNENTYQDKSGDVDCVELIEEICISSADCLSFELDCVTMWGASAYACSELECIRGCSKRPYTNIWRLSYVTYTPDYYSFVWEC